MQKNAIKKYEDKIEELEEHVDQITLTKESLQRHLDLANSKNIELEEELAAKRQNHVEAPDKFALQIKQQAEIIQTLEHQNRELKTLGSASIYNSDWEREKEVLEIDLKNRVDKVVQLQMQLDEARETIMYLQSTMGKGEVHFRKKNEELERALKELKLQQNQASSQMQMLQVDKEVFERRIKMIKEKKSLSKDQVRILKDRLREEVERNRVLEEQLNAGPKVPRISIPSNIKKPIKGGTRSTSIHHTEENPFFR